MTRVFRTCGKREWKWAVGAAVAAVVLAGIGPAPVAAQAVSAAKVSVVDGPTVTSDTISIDVENVPLLPT